MKINKAIVELGESRNYNTSKITLEIEKQGLQTSEIEEVQRTVYELVQKGLELIGNKASINQIELDDIELDDTLLD